MPVHVCPFDALQDTIKRIESQGERVVSTAQSGDTIALITEAAVTIRKKPGVKETR